MEAALSRDDARRRLHEAGLRATAPRVAVLRLLSEAGKPLSHTDVVQAIGDDDWDRTTLYRNLLKLVEANLARIASQVGGVARYEARVDDDPHLHPHFHCRSCGAVICLTESRLVGPVDGRWNRSLEAAELQVLGECPDCLAHKR